MICEDMWSPDVEALVNAGAELLVVLNGSPFGWTSRMCATAGRQSVAETRLPLIYVNLVGGQDELVFDGASFVLDADGLLGCRRRPGRRPSALTRWRRERGSLALRRGTMARAAQGLAAIYHAMRLGLRDYVEKNRFPGVVIGLSGGIDSARSAAVAVDALGADAGPCVMMPSPYTSRTAWRTLPRRPRLLGVRLDNVSIEPRRCGRSSAMLRHLRRHARRT